MHVFKFFLKQYTLYFMEYRVSFVEINVKWEKITCDSEKFCKIVTILKFVLKKICAQTQ